MSLPVTTIQESPDYSEWRGFAEVWTPDVWHLGPWPQAKLRLTMSRLEVQVPKITVEFVPDQVVESRLFRLPLPSLTIIFKEGDTHSLVSFSVLRISRIQQALEQNGFQIKQQRVWRTGFEAGKDATKYQLQSNSKK